MQTLPSPPFLIHVMWHPNCQSAAQMAERIRGHFGTHRFRNVAGGTGIDVMFEGTSGSGSPVRIPAIWGAGCPVAVVAMVDPSLVEDPEWVAYLRDLGDRAAMEAPDVRLIPVAMESTVLDDLPLEEQAIRWDEWGAETGSEAPEQRLIGELAYEFARVLRRHLQGELHT